MSHKNAPSFLELNLHGKKPVIGLMALFCYESLGIRNLGATFRNAGYECVELFYEDLKRNYFRYPKPHELKNVINLFREHKVDFVGLSVTSSYRKLAKLIAPVIREELGVPVICGSIDPTSCPDETMEYADAACVGDGEKALLSFMKGLEEGSDITGIQGLWLKKPDGGIIKNGMTEWVDINDLPIIHYDAPGKYHTRGGEVIKGDPILNDTSLSMVGSRGCPHACNFCMNSFFPKANSKYIRLGNIDRIISEIKAAQKIMDVRRVKFYDELFATNKKWTEEFVEKYGRQVGVPFDAFLHPHHINDNLVAKLVSAGMYTVDMGIQSGSERVSNDLYGRRLSNEKVLNATRILTRHGVNSNYDLIIDNPLETSEDKRKNFEFMLQVPRPYSLIVVSLTHMPKTPLTKQLLEEGYIKTEDVEGYADNSLFQWEVSLTYKRSAEDRFWLALISLLTKDFVPKPFIKLLSKSWLLKKFPAPLVGFAWVMNFIKLGFIVLKRLRAGTTTLQEIRRFANLRDLMVK
ncbi:MAG: B12-binding domain-containing radical SAM protein [Nitrospinota bacterium]|nr:B12-binding domain-containing radical SAM protein [Nitrospinota bacterium]